eukprot:662334-Alexandrium_andersonii.AAC.1
MEWQCSGRSARPPWSGGHSAGTVAGGWSGSTPTQWQARLGVGGGSWQCYRCGAWHKNPDE